VILDRVIFYHERTFTPKTEKYYSLKEPIIEYKHKDISGKLTLNEIYSNDSLTYRCEYRNGKKDGIEYCLLEDGSELNTNYKNGRRVK
jgi:antitoxin component YwqK of YwqJK toxin-antitoxin module